jgi:hypothetical protein
VSKKPETVFKERVYREISELGAHIYIEKIQQVAKRGSADFHLCVVGVFVAIELKMDGEKPDELQLFKLRKVEKAGGLAFVATPENWPFILETLKGLVGGENVNSTRFIRHEPSGGVSTPDAVIFTVPDVKNSDKARRSIRQRKSDGKRLSGKKLRRKNLRAA